MGFPESLKQTWLRNVILVGFSPRNRIRGWTGRLSSWKFRIQAMPDCQEASEIKKKLEILDRHLQLVIWWIGSRRAAGFAFLMVLRFREANRKIIFLGCDDNAPSKMNMVQPKNHQIETENHLSSTSVQARGNKDSRRNCLVPWRRVKGVWCAYRTFLLCSRFVVCTYIKIKGGCWIDRQSSFFGDFYRGHSWQNPKYIQ